MVDTNELCVPKRSSDSINERIKIIIEAQTPSTRRFIALEEISSISAKTWRTWWSRGGKVNGEMIESLSQAWPQFAFWLVTGWCDRVHGHIAPDGVKIIDIKRTSVLTAIG